MIHWFSRNVTETMNEIDDGFAFYKISFQWYSAIGAVMTWIPAIIVSHFTGGPDMSKFNIKLFAPFVQKMIPARYHHTELKTVDKKIHLEQSNEENGTKQELTGLMVQNNENGNKNEKE